MKYFFVILKVDTIMGFMIAHQPGLILNSYFGNNLDAGQ